MAAVYFHWSGNASTPAQPAAHPPDRHVPARRVDPTHRDWQYSRVAVAPAGFAARAIRTPQHTLVQPPAERDKTTARDNVGKSNVGLFPHRRSTDSFHHYQ